MCVYRSRARKLQTWARAQWRTLFAEREEEWRQLRPPLANASYERWTWALCAVWGRSFHLKCADPSCGGAAGTTGGGWRVLAPGADLLNHGARGTANAVLMQPPEGVKPPEWKHLLFTPDDSGGAEGQAAGGAAGGGAAAGASVGTSIDALGATGSAAAADGDRGSSRGKGRRKARAVASTHTTADAPRKRSRPRKVGRERDGAPLAPGLSDVALGGGGGVWRWREMEGAQEGSSAEGDARPGGAGLPPLWMEKVGCAMPSAVTPVITTVITPVITRSVAVAAPPPLLLPCCRCGCSASACTPSASRSRTQTRRLGTPSLQFLPHATRATRSCCAPHATSMPGRRC